MFLIEPEHTTYDLSWRMFGISVRVHPMFWLLTAILGWDTVQRGFEYLLLWIGCVFASILIHELGHVGVGRLFGTRGHIVLHGFGGLAIGSSGLSNRWQRIAVYFAGPLAGFLFLGLVILSDRLMALPNPSKFYERAYRFLFFINLVWGLLNLLPIWPLDGGQISRDFLGWMIPRKGNRVSLGVSVTVAGLLAANALAVEYQQPFLPFLSDFGGFYLAIFFGYLAFNSFQMLQQQGPQTPRRWDDSYEEW